MKTFVVKSASHEDASGKRYVAGDKITTSQDLVAAFGSEKFELDGQIKVINIAAQQPETPAKAEQASAKAEKQPQGQGKEEGQPGKEEEPTSRSELGEDVTKQFPSAVDNEFKVFKSKGWHHVTEPESPNKALNPKGLKADAVDTFIKTLLK